MGFSPLGNANGGLAIGSSILGGAVNRLVMEGVDRCLVEADSGCVPASALLVVWLEQLEGAGREYGLPGKLHVPVFHLRMLAVRLFQLWDSLRD